MQEPVGWKTTAENSLASRKGGEVWQALRGRQQIEDLIGNEQMFPTPISHFRN